MNMTVVMALVNNAALLLALFVVYEVSYIIPIRWIKIIPVFNGLLIGSIGLAIMILPYHFDMGIYFDARSILISITALTFGIVPVTVAASVMIIYRIILGGAGLLMGISTIITSACIGIIWKRFLMPKNTMFRWINIYLFGITVQLAMLADAFTLPKETAMHILGTVGMPVLLIFPVATVLLSLLLLHQKERNESLIKVAEAEDKYKSIFNNSHGVMLLIDPETGQIIDANLAASKFYGWSISTLRSMNISEINTLNKEELLEEMRKAATEKRTHFLFRHMRASADPVDVEVYSGPIKLQGKVLIYSIVHDISERKNLEYKKNEMEAQMRQQQKLEAIGTLAGGVAHEINNPINGIMNYAQLILDDETDRNSVSAEYAKEIIRETERVAMIVKNLLQFSRQEKQSHSYASIYDIIDQTVSLIKTVVKGDQITLAVVLDENLPDIKCRSQQIQQVLMNLLTNARDALNEKYPEYHKDKLIRISCSQYNKDERRWIRITVEDHGNGISPAIQEKIFEPFFSTKPKDLGTGLGLSISFGIVKDHHGKISIDTKEGECTRFIVDLPVDNGWTLADTEGSD